MLQILWWLSMLLIPPLALAMIVLNLKKKFNHTGKKKWAFFHPFW